MKQPAAYLLIAAMLLCSVASAADPRESIELPNAKFDQPLDRGWRISHGQVSIVTDPDNPQEKCLHLGDSASVLSRKLIPFEPGYHYFMSARVRYHNVRFLGKNGGGIRNSVMMGLHELNADRETINGNWYYMMGHVKYEEGDFAWFDVVRDWRPKDTTAYLRPFIQTDIDPGGEVWFDDIRVWRVKLAARQEKVTTNIIQNGSFEVYYHEDNRLTPNGYAATGAADKLADYAESMTCDLNGAAIGQSSLKLIGECAIASSDAALNSKQATVSISIRTEGSATHPFAQIVFLDAKHAVIASEKISDLTPTTPWTRYTKTIDPLPNDAVYARWEFGNAPGSTGCSWFDDLQITVPTLLRPLPKRPKNTSQAHVRIDCTQRSEPFVSPLNAYDIANADRVYSPTVGTAGPWVEGPNRWYANRRRLGFDYVRVHGIYGANGIYTETYENGQWIARYSTARKNPETGRDFPPVFDFNDKGEPVYDFSSIRYLLDKCLLVGGCKPMLDLASVPAPLAINSDGRYIPRDERSWKLWEELNYRFIKFLVETYGRQEVATWMFETANEPGSTWTFRGDPAHQDDASICDAFIKLQDYIVAGATRALPEVFIAGPSGPGIGWLERMLEHCATEKNFAAGKIGTKIDAISAHGYLGGSTTDLSWRATEEGMMAMRSLAERFYAKTGKRIRIFNTEYAPILIEGKASLNSITHEFNNHIQAIGCLHMGHFSYRQGVSMMVSFPQSPTGAALIDGVPMDDVPEFIGRMGTITFHGIYTPLSRAHQMMAMLNGTTEVAAHADVEPIWTIAGTTDDEIRILCYSFEPNSKADYTTRVKLTITTGDLGKKFTATRCELSKTESNAWAVATKMKLTQGQCHKDPSLVDRVNNETEFKPKNMGTVTAQDGTVTLDLSMPAYSAQLITLKRVSE